MSEPKKNIECVDSVDSIDALTYASLNLKDNNDLPLWSAKRTEEDMERILMMDNSKFRKLYEGTFIPKQELPIPIKTLELISKKKLPTFKL